MSNEEFLRQFKVLVGDRSNGEIARLLKVSKPTVDRWISGVNFPHQLVMSGILNKLTDSIL